MMSPKEIIGLVIGIYLISALIGGAITALNDVNTTDWTTQQIAIWAVIPTVIIASIIIAVVD